MKIAGSVGSSSYEIHYDDDTRDIVRVIENGDEIDPWDGFNTYAIDEINLLIEAVYGGGTLPITHWDGREEYPEIYIAELIVDDDACLPAVTTHTGSPHAGTAIDRNVCAAAAGRQAPGQQRQRSPIPI